MSETEFMPIIHTLISIFDKHTSRGKIDWDLAGNESVCACTSCTGHQGDTRVNPNSILPIWGMKTVAVSMVTTDLGLFDKC